MRKKIVVRGNGKDWSQSLRPVSYHLCNPSCHVMLLSFISSFSKGGDKCCLTGLLIANERTGLWVRSSGFLSAVSGGRKGLGESVQQPQGACDRGLNERGPLLSRGSPVPFFCRVVARSLLSETFRSVSLFNLQRVGNFLLM